MYILFNLLKNKKHTKIPNMINVCWGWRYSHDQNTLRVEPDKFVCVCLAVTLRDRFAHEHEFNFYSRPRKLTIELGWAHVRESADSHCRVPEIREELSRACIIMQPYQPGFEDFRQSPISLLIRMTKGLCISTTGIGRQYTPEIRGWCALMAISIGHDTRLISRWFPHR